MELKVKDLVPGEIYHCHEIINDADGIEKDLELVFKFKGDNGDPDRAHSEYYVSIVTHTQEGSNISKTFRKDAQTPGECTPWITGRNCRPATLMEKQWLMRSAMEDKYTEKPIKMAEPISFINKDQIDLTLDDFYDGQIYEGEISHRASEYKPTIGKVTIEEGKIFLCQDWAEGDYCKEKHGYKFSYGITNGGILRLGGEGGNVEGIFVQNLKIQRKTPSLEKVGNVLDMTWYANVVGLDDPADDRLMLNFTSDFEFIGFSKQNKGPIFKIKNAGQTEAYWYENVISKITEMGGMISMVAESQLQSHLEETLQ